MPRPPHNSNKSGGRRQVDGLPICVTDLYGVWPSLRISPCIPLGRLDWMWHSNGHSIRESSSSARASFQLSPSSSPSKQTTEGSKSQKQQQLPLTYKDSQYWYLNPYVYVFVISIELLDKSANATDVWTALRVFIEQCRELKHEHIVVCSLPDGDDSTQQKRIFDKLRYEVNHASKIVDRVVAISFSKKKSNNNSKTKDSSSTSASTTTTSTTTSPSHPSTADDDERSLVTNLHYSHAHRDFLLRVREFVRDSVQVRLQQYEDELVRVYEKSKSNADWCLTSFLLIKEGISSVFSHLGRRDMAVKHYEHVHSLMSDHPILFTSFCDLSPSQAAQAVANVSARDYHAMLLASKITELDLYTYVHAQQFALLLGDRKYTQIAEKGISFIAYVQKRCNELIASASKSSSSSATETAKVNSNRLTVVFRDVWIFTTARIFSTMLGPAVPNASSKDANQNNNSKLQSVRERFAVRQVAGFHVQALKALQNLAQIVLPGCLSSDEPRIADPNKRKELSKEVMTSADDKLRKALSSRHGAETLYSEMANAAASLYEMGHRARGAAALDGDAGIVHLINKSYGEAESHLTAQCSRFMNDTGWDILHRRQRANLAEAEKNLNKTQEYLVSCLTMLLLNRTSRALTPISHMADNEVAKLKKEASLWVSETVKTATVLPRVMRYKADRLFNLSVLPNSDSWEDASPASAIVRIKSDILTDFPLDFLHLECKCVDAPSSRKPALHQHRQDIPTKHDSVASASTVLESCTSSSSSVSVVPDPSEPLDMFVLKSANGIVLKPGVTDVPVSASEVPHFGRYWVNHVSMFIGQLKFVYTANKPGNNPIASIHDKTALKPSMATTPSSPLVDFCVFEAHTPFFYASRRTPSATLRYIKRKPLYLVPKARQSVSIKISAGEKGIAAGARLVCSLSVPTDSGILAVNNNGIKNSFVRFYQNANEDSPQITDDGDGRVRVSLKQPKDPDPVEPVLDFGEVLFDRELHAGEVLSVRIELEVLNDDGPLQSSTSNDGGLFTSQECKLTSQLRWCELGSRNGRRFSTLKDTHLTFSSPIDISTCVELHHERSADSVSSGVSLDGTPLGDGGTLLTTISSPTTRALAVEVRQVRLETPSWLELRTDEDAPHASLLPCSLQAGSELVCAFDVFQREEVDSGKPLVAFDRDDDSEAPEENPEDALRERLSRRNGRAPPPNMSDVLREDSRDTGDYEPDTYTDTDQTRSDLQLPDTSASATPDKAPGDARGRNAADNRPALSEDSSGSSKPVSPLSDATGRPANDLVDLSSGDNLFSDPVPVVAALEEVSGDVELDVQSEHHLTARLFVELRIPGVVDWTVIERVVSIKALQRTGMKRYGISRDVPRVGEVGRVLDMDVHVWTVGYPHHHRVSGDNDITLTHGGAMTVKMQYDIVFDPAVWIVVGQQRGVIRVPSSGGGATATATVRLLPIKGGRHALPRIALYTQPQSHAAVSAGGGAHSSLIPLPLAQHEVVDEHMQIVVMPCRTVVNACHGNEAVIVDGGDDGGMAGGNMPIVVSSNIFFES